MIFVKDGDNYGFSEQVKSGEYTLKNGKTIKVVKPALPGFLIPTNLVEKIPSVVDFFGILSVLVLHVLTNEYTVDTVKDVVNDMIDLIFSCKEEYLKETTFLITIFQSKFCQYLHSEVMTSLFTAGYTTSKTITK